MRSVRLPFLRPVQPAPAVEVSPWQPAWWAVVLLAAVVLGVLIGIVLSQTVATRPLERYRYHLWRWQAETLTSSVFHRLGVGDGGSGAAAEETLRRYFALTSELRATAERETPDLALIEALSAERATYENDVEAILRSYISEAIRSAGLQERLPLFSSEKIVWPPVEMELTSPPRLLVRSPRDHIERAGDTLLKTGLSAREIEKIEAQTEDDDTVSLVVSIGGLAAYPAFVRDDRSYDGILETAAHEWVHHYLAFYPLGQTWGKGGVYELLNETTANIAGRELANLVRKRHPLTFPENADGRAPAGRPPAVEFNKVMRQLRLDVDALLKKKKVEEAERLMEERRQYLAENGIPIRKLNQAYFAFYGTYGDSPASSDPRGPRIEKIWEATKDAGAFLKLMREVKNVGDVEQTLARVEAASGIPR